MKVAGTRHLASRKLRAIGAGLVGSRPGAVAAPESGVFRGFPAVRGNVKVRCFDALACGLPAGCRVALATVENHPQCGVLAR